ncbi:MAG: isocitrate lyase/PEP mutase family protein [Actinobacteria bacterium]|nr:isocitrate lyase/PEP mutase family protein [Actinomycetota bacterium]MBO0836628.1 isocitrate lyase/PEP mutase family protein [Actinomycetota bacterium]
MVLAPGAYDALTARLVARNGFPAVYMTGAGTSVAHGYPDYGLLTMTEMVDNAARMTAAVDIPVIADADTGYGNELNVIRTVQAYARAGVAAIHIEDQTFPKRCGHLAGKEIIERDAWLRKIRAGVECRPDNRLVIIARTDARAVAGLDEAIERARAALAVGADVAFVEAPLTVEEIAAVPAAVGGPCLYNVVPGGRSPEVGLTDLATWGYRIAIFPSLLITPVVAACEEALTALALTVPGQAAGPGSPTEAGDLAGGPAALFRRVGAEEWDRLRERYGEPDNVSVTR